MYGPLRLTYPPEEQPSTPEAETEADLLPFAIDRESSLSSPIHATAQQDDVTIGALSEMDLNMSGEQNGQIRVCIEQVILTLL